MSCSCDIYDVEPYTFWETTQKARKQHKCAECGSDIDPTEKYTRISGIYEGKFFVHKVCETCDRIFKESALEAQKHDMCICLGELWNFLGM